MSRPLQQLLIFFGLVVALGVLRAPYFVAPTLIDRSLQSVARQQRVELQTSSASFAFPAQYSVASATLRFPNETLPTPVVLSNVSANLSPGPLFRGQLDSTFNFSLYNGVGTGVVRRSFFNETLSIASTLREVNLASLPSPFPIRIDGIATITWNGTVDPKTQSANGEFSAEISNGHYPGGYKVMGLVEVPEISDLTLQLKGSINGNSLTIPELGLQSSLGTAAASATLSLSTARKIESMAAQVRLKLSAVGAQKFSALLQLAANGKGRPDTSGWLVDVTQSKNQKFPSFSVTPEG